MLQYDLVIVGGGASGLSAGVSALRNGIKNVLILDRNNELGGNLNIFIHNGFGRYFLGTEVTGPELSSELIREYRALKGSFKLNTELLEISKNKVLTYVNPEEGIQEIKASSIILASGCREKFTGNINIPIHRYTGIFTLLSAHKLVNLQGYLPGKKVVVVGNNKWSLIFARRLEIEGAEIQAFLDTSKNGLEEYLDIIEGFNINIIKKHRVIELYGNERIKSVDIRNLEDNTVKNIECDSLVLKIGYYPETFLIRKVNMILDDKGHPVVNKDFQTSEKGIFATGTLVLGEDSVFNSGENGYIVGIKASEYIKKYIY